MREVTTGLFGLFVLFLSRGESGTLKWKVNSKEKINLDEPEIVGPEYTVPQATIKLLKPKGFSISIPARPEIKTVGYDVTLEKLQFGSFGPNSEELGLRIISRVDCDQEPPSDQIYYEKKNIGIVEGSEVICAIDFLYRDNSTKSLRIHVTLNRTENNELKFVPVYTQAEADIMKLLP